MQPTGPVSAALVRQQWLFQAALICQKFPAYRLADVQQMPGSQVRDLLLAIQLISVAREVNESG